MGSKISKYQAREQRALVREILMNEWDPIGVRDIGGAESEYDGYVGTVYMMILEKQGLRDIESFLLKAASVNMGLSMNDELLRSTERAAERLVALLSQFQSH